MREARRPHANHYPARQAMKTFLSIHQDVITGTLETFDRIIFKGHLLDFYPENGMAIFLSRQKILLKDFGSYVEKTSEELKAHIQKLADDAKRPYLYLEKNLTAKNGRSKEDYARELACQDGVTDGLICVFAVVEPCQAFGVKGNPKSHKLEVRRQFRKCLHFYLYYLDAEFGLMHIRLQSWFPFEIQIYFNGREWLARQLDKLGIAYTRYDNKLTNIANLKVAKDLCDRFVRRKWPRVLKSFAKRVNPLLPRFRRAGLREYYWVIHQAEYATDVFFANRPSLIALYPALVQAAMTLFGAEDVMRFLGRKLHGNFKGELRSDLKHRPQGCRVKHFLARNSIKMYDPANILRIETTVNNPREFRVLRVLETKTGKQRRWLPMGKGVANFWRYAQVGQLANARYLEALAHVQPVGKAIDQLDTLCQPKTKQGKRFARFNPVSADDGRLFATVLRGEFSLNGFRNKELVKHLYAAPARTDSERRQRSAHVTRLLAKLRGHGLITKVKQSRLYRLSDSGLSLLTAAVHYRQVEFPRAMMSATG
jgi:hypothetical protein